MAAPNRAHVRARDCALAAQWPATSGRNMLLFRASCCATGCRDFTLGCATRWPLSRETIARPMAAYRALMRATCACLRGCRATWWRRPPPSGDVSGRS
ncbi:histone-lysine N-methyltransferase, H3 lysine-9 specific SUVH6-like [Dorcoceras hygrometricum]|uniref:Histone-lysine N-methyltransferase, H3 lysine-9 specific SUVH6-like n=1 Tax=Dorcoceras hygrometricum TaxID=472368 RepID=A0A2Z7BZT4_9LAMI|nr:histone-lysine N-methyltransferase, H3 lysine-9 specific SUVH6-like [Dorcoceras hygrometricum]